MNKKFLKIAEIGMTHDGSFGLAKQLTKSAVQSGANVVKYQCHIPEFETTRNDLHTILEMKTGLSILREPSFLIINFNNYIFYAMNWEYIHVFHPSA